MNCEKDFCNRFFNHIAACNRSMRLHPSIISDNDNCTHYNNNGGTISNTDS